MLFLIYEVNESGRVDIKVGDYQWIVLGVDDVVFF